MYFFMFYILSAHYLYYFLKIMSGDRHRKGLFLPKILCIASSQLWHLNNWVLKFDARMHLDTWQVLPAESYEICAVFTKTNFSSLKIVDENLEFWIFLCLMSVERSKRRKWNWLELLVSESFVRNIFFFTTTRLLIIFRTTPEMTI